MIYEDFRSCMELEAEEYIRQDEDFLILSEYQSLYPDTFKI